MLIKLGPWEGLLNLAGSSLFGMGKFELEILCVSVPLWRTVVH